MVGFTNASVPWGELEARLSGRSPTAAGRRDAPIDPGRTDQHRTDQQRTRHRSEIVPYAELHCHSHFSFLDGASSPSELADEADRLGLEALALTDHDGFYGVVRFAEAAREVGLACVFGAEVTLDLPTRPDPGAPDPAGGHLVLLADGPDGYHSVSRALSLAQLAGTKGAPRQSLSDLADLGGDVIALTGCRKGTVPSALEAHGPAAAARELARLVELFGRDRVAVELWDHGHPLDGHRNDALAELAVRAGVEVVATNNVHYATPRQQPLATALAAVRARRSLDDLDGWLPAAAGAHLRSGAEQQRRFARYPGAVEATVGIARACAFDLALVAPALPPFPCPDGIGEMAYLRRLVDEGAIRRYGPRPEPASLPRTPRTHPDPHPGLDPASHSSRPTAKFGGKRLPSDLLPPNFGESRGEGRGERREESRGEVAATAWRQLDHELAVIDQLGFPGYFLVVWDIVRFCGEMNIFCQGRGSAANSAVCFSLGITRADAVRLGLLFERFLSPARDGPPDIDLDIESGRREEVIQYVYERYGRHHAAQVANVITYRGRSAVRDMARALGYAPGQQDAWAKQVDRWGSLAETPSGEPARPRATDGEAADGREQHHDAAQSDPRSSPRGDPQMAKPDRRGEAADGRKQQREAEASRAEGPPESQSNASRSAWRGETLRPGEHSIPPEVLDLARQTQGAPRHLGIHSGGMVICDRPVIEVCPVEHARMEGRTVLQWDKDDCAAAGLVKFDLLGLGMLTALHHAVDLIAAHRGYELDLAALRQEDEVYEMLCRADSIGVFQVESRAQMATLPRLKPRNFYDLVVEVALIRPGPIQGGSVHPYIRRRNGIEEVTYAHPLLEPALAKTLGVPLFQEQFMQIAIDAAGFSATEADELRQAMGSKRSRTRMDRLRERLFTGMAARGITGEVAEDIWHKLTAFADYGFPESHAVSFAYLVYSSSWIKLHEPAAFCAALLNAQPMGFYSPHTLCQDARRHGVTVQGPDLVRSVAAATLEPCADSHNQMAVRLGLSSVRGIGDDQAAAIVAEREANGPFGDLADLARRTGLNQTQLESLALAGAVPTAVPPPSSSPFTGEAGKGETTSSKRNRRQALWAAGAAAQSRPGRLPGIVTGTDAPTLPGLSASEEAVADLVATGISATGHPTRFIRDELDRMGVIPAARLATVRIPADATEADRTTGPPELRSRRVLVAGVVTHRQRPATAGGTMFINLEDETGLVNVIASKGCWMRYRAVARGAPALVVRGRLERVEGVVNVVAEKITELDLDLGPLRSRNFR